jgi:hypothetical protein
MAIGLGESKEKVRAMMIEVRETMDMLDSGAIQH